MYLLGLVLGGLEIFIHVWVLLLAFDGSGWAMLGLIAYYIFCLSNNGWTLSSVVATILTPICFALIFLYFGFWITVLAFGIFVVVCEFIPKD